METRPGCGGGRRPPPRPPQALTPPPATKKPPLAAAAAADLAAQAKAHSAAAMAAHRAWQADLGAKLRLKRAALAALPAGPVRDAAAAPDYSPFPAGRAVWTDTPPIPGFEAAAAGDGGGGREAAPRPRTRR